MLSSPFRRRHPSPRPNQVLECERLIRNSEAHRRRPSQLGVAAIHPGGARATPIDSALKLFRFQERWVKGQLSLPVSMMSQ